MDRIEDRRRIAPQAPLVFLYHNTTLSQHSGRLAWRLVPFLIIGWAYFNAHFIVTLHVERTEATLEGMAATALAPTIALEAQRLATPDAGLAQLPQVGEF